MMANLQSSETVKKGAAPNATKLSPFSNGIS